MTARILEGAAKSRPEDVFYVWQERELSVGDVNARANRLAHGLVAIGVEAGRRVAVLMENSPAYMDLWFALAKVGAVEVPINTAYRGDLLAYQLKNCGATLVFVDPEHAGRVEEVRDDVQEMRVVRADPDGEGFRELSALSEDVTDLATPVDVRDLGSVLYTSGTTGPSKGVMLSHHQQATFGMFYAQIVGLADDDVVLNYLPHFHIAGKFLSTACLLTGARMVLSPRLSVSSFWDEVRREGVTNFIAVGGVCNMLAARPERPDEADNPVRVVYAVPAPAEIYDTFERRFGCKLIEAYGSTEAGLVTYTDLDERRPGSCGRPNHYFDVKVLVGADRGEGEIVEQGEGEIVVRPHEPFLMMSGYLGMAEATERAWRDGWFHTGDRARVDADGSFWFLDRIKDSIRRRGENVSSFEVERLVGAHPAVAEVAAVAGPSALGEDEVMVFVVPCDGQAVDAEELFLHCARSMPYFMVPRFIEVVAELERTPTSKVAKYRLRARGVAPTTWDAEQSGWRMTRHGAVPRSSEAEASGGELVNKERR
jgi:crotonobetaine/carnitine-CoA ligase